MKRLYTLLTIVAASLTLVSCTQLLGPETTSETVQQAIEKAAAQFAEAFNQGDTAAVADFYLTEAQILPPNAPMVSGQEAIQEFWQGFIETTAWRELTLETLKIEHDGRLVYEVGAYTFNFQVKGANQAVTDTGKYLVVWKRQSDRSYKILVDTWNSNMLPSVP